MQMKRFCRNPEIKEKIYKTFKLEKEKESKK
jgi:hypothetical protein